MQRFAYPLDVHAENYYHSPACSAIAFSPKPFRNHPRPDEWQRRECKVNDLSSEQELVSKVAELAEVLQPEG